MIFVTKKADGSYELVNGHTRLRATLSIFDQAEVYDQSNGVSLFVHEVDGKLLAVSADDQANLEDQVVAAINRARAGSKSE